VSSVRLANVADLDLLVRHRRGMFEDMGRDSAQQIAEHDTRYGPWALAAIEDGTMVGFIAEEAGRVVASGCLWLQPRQPSPRRPGLHVPYFLSMFTERDCRRQGHAEVITRAAMDWAREHGFGQIVLHASDMGRGLYERLGFKRTWEMEVAIPPVSEPAPLKDVP
jgi:GNAT superfamily N-acetyltransferase